MKACTDPEMAYTQQCRNMHEQIRIEQRARITRSTEEQQVDFQKRTACEYPFLEALYAQQMIVQIMTVDTVSGDERTDRNYHRNCEEDKCDPVFTFSFIVIHQILPRPRLCPRPVRRMKA